MGYGELEERYILWLKMIMHMDAQSLSRAKFEKQSVRGEVSREKVIAYIYGICAVYGLYCLHKFKAGI